LTRAIVALATVYWKIGHYPQRLKYTRIIVLYKLGKAIYNVPGSWRPIALLNIIGKLIEAITASRIRKAAKEYNLLPRT
jgi:hypothetical protein